MAAVLALCAAPGLLGPRTTASAASPAAPHEAPEAIVLSAPDEQLAALHAVRERTRACAARATPWLEPHKQGEAELASAAWGALERCATPGVDTSSGVCGPEVRLWLLATAARLALLAMETAACCPPALEPALARALGPGAPDPALAPAETLRDISALLQRTALALAAGATGERVAQTNAEQMLSADAERRREAEAESALRAAVGSRLSAACPPSGTDGGDGDGDATAAAAALGRAPAGPGGSGRLGGGGWAGRLGGSGDPWLDSQLEFDPSELPPQLHRAAQQAIGLIPPRPPTDEPSADAWAAALHAVSISIEREPDGAEWAARALSAAFAHAGFQSKYTAKLYRDARQAWVRAGQPWRFYLGTAARATRSTMGARGAVLQLRTALEQVPPDRPEIWAEVEAALGRLKRRAEADEQVLAWRAEGSQMNERHAVVPQLELFAQCAVRAAARAASDDAPSDARAAAVADGARAPGAEDDGSGGAAADGARGGGSTHQQPDEPDHAAVVAFVGTDNELVGEHVVHRIRELGGLAAWLPSEEAEEQWLPSEEAEEHPAAGQPAAPPASRRAGVRIDGYDEEIGDTAQWEAALLDLALLSRTRVLVGTAGSTFSALAAGMQPPSARQFTVYTRAYDACAASASPFASHAPTTRRMPPHGVSGWSVLGALGQVSCVSPEMVSALMALGGEYNPYLSSRVRLLTAPPAVDAARARGAAANRTGAGAARAAGGGSGAGGGAPGAPPEMLVGVDASGALFAHAMPQPSRDHAAAPSDAAALGALAAGKGWAEVAADDALAAAAAAAADAGSAGGVGSAPPPGGADDAPAGAHDDADAADDEDDAAADARADAAEHAAELAAAEQLAERERAAVAAMLKRYSELHATELRRAHAWALGEEGAGAPGAAERGGRGRGLLVATAYCNNIGNRATNLLAYMVLAMATRRALVLDSSWLDGFQLPIAADVRALPDALRATVHAALNGTSLRSRVSWHEHQQGLCARHVPRACGRVCVLPPSAGAPHLLHVAANPLYRRWFGRHVGWSGAGLRALMRWLFALDERVVARARAIEAARCGAEGACAVGVHVRRGIIAKDNFFFDDSQRASS